MAPYIRFERFGATLLRAVLWIAVGAAIAASAYLGFAYAGQYGLAFGVIAVAAEIFKPVAMQIGLQYLGSLETWWKAPLFLVVAFVCLLYSLMAELSIAATNRGDIVAGRAAHTLGAQNARGDRQRTLAELAALKPSRAVAELEVLVRAARPRCVIHVDLGRRETVCYKDPKLVGELARAKHRVELEAQIASLPPPATLAVADPLADTVALLYADATGITVNVDSLSKRLYLLPVILIEVVTAFGIVVARAASEALPGAKREAPPTLSKVAKVAKGRRYPAYLWHMGRHYSDGTVRKGAKPNYRKRRLPEAKPEPLPRVRGKVGKVSNLSPEPVPTFTESEVIAAQKRALLATLERVDRPVTNIELAQLLGCSEGETSRRVSRLNGTVCRVKVGRHVAITLASHSGEPKWTNRMNESTSSPTQRCQDSLKLGERHAG